ncbi:hypothetical protein HUT16_28225 [Kitasatospora sp. NA04385]|nr:hypothetical protein HUT16_28225 [Kitasatospora sp. NA04385]
MAARSWLAGRGVRSAGDGWVSDGQPGVPLTANQVAHSWAAGVFAEDLDRAGQLTLAFGLLDLLDDYWVTCEIGSAHRGEDGPLPADVLWDGYRQRLEAERDAEAVTHSLWVDWFEDRATAATAFAEVLGDDVERVVSEPTAPRLRRARRVLEHSGPVPWTVKEPAYRTAARLPALHPALFRALLASHRDVHGDVAPAPALALLDRLDLPAGTPHLADLRRTFARS